MTPLPERCPRDVDMSPDVFEQRLHEVSELNYLCMTLASAKRLGTVNRVRAREQAAREAIATLQREGSSSLPPRHAGRILILVRNNGHPQIAQSDADYMTVFVGAPINLLALKESAKSV